MSSVNWPTGVSFGTVYKSGNFSHFIWKNDDTITAWASTEDGGKAAFYEFYDKSKRYKMLDDEKMPENGHNTYVPNTSNEWILNDTYPYRHPEHK